MKRAFAVVAAWAVVQVFSSCSADQSALKAGDIDRPCSVNEECGAGLVCEGFRCAPPKPDVPDELHIEIAPQIGSTYLKTQQLDVRVSADQLLELMLQAPTEYRMHVFDDGDELIELNARISFAGRNRIPGRTIDLVSEIRVNDENTQRLRLLPGEYDTTIARFDERPSLRTSFEVRASTMVLAKNFQFVPLRRISGTVLDSLRRETRIAGARLSAISLSYGLSSTSTISDSEGEYAIELPDTDDNAFRLVASAPEQEQPAWAFEEVVTVAAPERIKEVLLEPTSAESKGRARLRFGGNLDRGFEAVAGARVTMTSSTGTRVYRVNGETDAEGYLRAEDGSREVPLLKGVYTVEIEPPLGSRLSRTVEPQDLTAVSPDGVVDRQITLSPRIQVIGAIYSDLGRPVPFASIEMHPVDYVSVPFLAAADQSGAFEVWLDRGLYIMVVTPSAGTDLNETVPTSARFQQITQLGMQDLGFISMPAAATVAGRIIGELDGNGVTNARVLFFQEMVPVGMEDFPRSILLGEARTTQGGHFTVVLPR